MHQQSASKSRLRLECRRSILDASERPQPWQAAIFLRMKRTNPRSAEPTKPNERPAERDLPGTNEPSEGSKESSKSKPTNGASEPKLEPKPDSIPHVASVPLGLSLSGS